ncbi:MAG: hypothetical protein IPK82_27970 [Polyangiaceae bacterium]|nr:hypothetical protein [Polyangiaceae bacterium]
MMRPIFSLLAVLTLSAATLACARRPARFADATPVTEVADDEPIDLPLLVEYNDVVEFSDLFVGRPLVEAMRTTRKPPPADINAHDEVPTSSWFAPVSLEPSAFELAYTESGPPVPPYRVLLERAPSGNNGIAVIDQLGRRFELRRDPADRPEVRTAAAAVSARIVRALGYYAPEVYISDAADGDFAIAPDDSHPSSITSGMEPQDPEVRRKQLTKTLQEWLESAPANKKGAYRFSATRWPPGIDVGRTPVAGVRSNDPNDRVPHENRRTLRAMKLVGAWLGMTRFTPHDLRDVYRGIPGEGHLVHYIVGMDKSLGTEAIVGKRPEQKDEMTLLATLGFAPDPNIPPTQRKYKALGALGEEVDVGRYGPALPFPAMDQIDGADAYWAAKRIASVTDEMVQLAVRAGKVGNSDARKLLFELILARKRHVLAWGYAQTTPCDVEAVEDRGIVVVDRAVAEGFTAGQTVEYVVSYFDSSGEPTHPGAVLSPEGARFAVPIPRSAVAADGYTVIRLMGEVGGVPAPRHLEMHVIRDGKGTRLVGVRH